LELNAENLFFLIQIEIIKNALRFSLQNNLNLIMISENIVNLRIYFLQICLGISYMHHQNYIYRDLKPENILIDLDGNAKIADFGLSKALVNHEMAYSFCGS
jgi:serine/threonine protein kinase